MSCHDPTRGKLLNFAQCLWEKIGAHSSLNVNAIHWATSSTHKAPNEIFPQYMNKDESVDKQRMMKSRFSEQNCSKTLLVHRLLVMQQVNQRPQNEKGLLRLTDVDQILVLEF